MNNRLGNVTDVAELIRSGTVPAAELEELGAALASRMPPRDRDERDFLIRQFARRFGPITGSERALIRWLILDVTRFEAGPDWRASRHKFLSPFADERRTLVWRILKFDDLPARSTLAEILNLRQ